MAKYWNEEQEQAVRDYISSGVTQDEKDVIYRTYLEDAMVTMTESIIRRYHLYVVGISYDVLFYDTISFVQLQIHKFKPDKVSEKSGLKVKAFSYIQTIIKNRLLGLRNKESVKSTRFALSGDIYSSFQDNDATSYEMEVFNSTGHSNLISKTVSQIEKKLEDNNKIKNTGKKLLLNENEEKVGLGLIQLLNNWENIIEDSNNKVNKNMTLQFLRDFTFLDTKHIRKAMVKYKNVYYCIKEMMIEKDEL